METKVTLASWTSYPIETVYYLWEVARHNKPMESLPEGIYVKCLSDKDFKAKVRETFEKVVDSAIPIAENLWFVFLLEGVSISFREQMVRHRVGVKVGERLGVDMFPDIHDSTWWAQSMRVLDMGKFVDKEMFRMPESIKKDPVAEENYLIALSVAQEAYKRLLENGVPIEDAREVIPLGAQHRVSWCLNLSSLIHVLKKRSCWVPQLGTWGPVIEGMVNELATKVDPYFRKLVTPPCVKNNKFVKCLYELDNERRVKREDPLLPCSIYMEQHEINELTVEMDQEKFKELEKKYENFWGRDTRTGKLINSNG